MKPQPNLTTVGFIEAVFLYKYYSFLFLEQTTTDATHTTTQVSGLSSHISFSENHIFLFLQVQGITTYVNRTTTQYHQTSLIDSIFSTNMSTTPKITTSVPHS